VHEAYVVTDDFSIIHKTCPLIPDLGWTFERDENQYLPVANLICDYLTDRTL